MAERMKTLGSQPKRRKTESRAQRSHCIEVSGGFDYTISYRWWRHGALLHEEHFQYGDDS